MSEQAFRLDDIKLADVGLRDKGGVCPVVRDVVMYAKSYSGSNDRTFCLCEEVCILESLRSDHEESNDIWDSGYSPGHVETTDPEN